MELDKLISVEDFDKGPLILNTLLFLIAEFFVFI